MERWDAYDRDGTPAGLDLIRGEPIPKGLYHLVSGVLVRHTDGDYLLMQRDPGKPNFPGYYEATAGGSALKGEDALACAKRELYEETGIAAGTFTEIDRRTYEDGRIFYSFLCRTGWDKTAIRLQEGETVAFCWVGEKEFADFIRSERAIPAQMERYQGYFLWMGYRKA